MTIQSHTKKIFSFRNINEIPANQIGGKATNLVLLQRAHLPIPDGFCIPTSEHFLYLKHNAIDSHLIKDIAYIKKKLGGKIAMRSSANCEDGTNLSMAGVFHSHYVYEDREILPAIKNIYDHAHSKEVSEFLKLHGKSIKHVQMGIVIQKLIEPDISGVIYTHVNRNNYLVQYTKGFGAHLVDGETQGSMLLMNKHGVIKRSVGFESTPITIDVIEKMTQLTHTIEKIFPDTPQDIEFAVQDHTVYILQSRPLTTDIGSVHLNTTPEETINQTKRKVRSLVAAEKNDLGTRTAIFSDANYSELLPKPTEMDIGIYMYIWGGCDGIPGATQIGRKDMGYLVAPESIGIINYIGGRTYSSIARYAGVYHIGFPTTKKEYFTTLVNEYLDAIEKDPEKGAYPQMKLFLQDPTLKDLEFRFGKKAQSYFNTYQQFVMHLQTIAEEFIVEFQTKRHREHEHFIQDMQKITLDDLTTDKLHAHGMHILEHIRTETNVDFVKAARLGFYYSQKLHSFLSEKLHINDHAAEELYAKLNQGLDGSAITQANISIAEAPTEKEALIIASKLIGHFNTGEMLEIRHEPLRDNPIKLKAYVQGLRKTGNYLHQFTKQKLARLNSEKEILSQLSPTDAKEIQHMIKASQTYMALRETVKYIYTKEYLLFRNVLEGLQKRLCLKTGDIYFIYPRELKTLITDPKTILHLIRSRRQSFKNYELINMPAVICEDNIESIGLTSDDDTVFNESIGRFLADGPKVRGIIFNLDEFDTLEHAASKLHSYLEHESIILVATQMNLSHDPFIAQSAGLIIENAGIVAHGAQRARELGKGALGGIKSRLLKTGMNVLFDPKKRLVKRI